MPGRDRPDESFKGDNTRGVPWLASANLASASRLFASSSMSSRRLEDPVMSMQIAEARR
jgi:hypothetical protein